MTASTPPTPRPTLRYTSAKEEAPPPLGMAPLVDIVLLLICFYLFVMQSIQSQAEETIDLPQIRSEATQELMPAELTINLDAAGVIKLNGVAVDDETLPTLLSAEQAKALDTGQRLQVVVRADRRQSFERLDAVMSACREVGFASVSVRSVQGVLP
ncbi:MAG: biopolymer transporter ExbD [Planctomycetota bacterium]